MKAIVYHAYGSPDVLRYEDVVKPVPSDNQVLIRVRAASLNPLDVGLMKGQPYFARFFFGFPKPKVTRPGRDVAGEVEAVGSNVTRFKPGDAVFGACAGKGWMDKVDGAFAEYACTSDTALAAKPANVAFEQAASVPVAGLTALQGLRDKGMLQPGQSVLINGAGGGVGTFAVQIAKALGAEVTAVSSSKNFELMLTMGADHVIDYTQEDFTKSPQRYDIVFDCHTSHSLFACKRVLKPKGKYVAVGGPTGHWLVAIVHLLTAAFVALLLSRFTRQKLVMFVAKVNKEDLNTLAELMASGKVKPVIDKCYRLSEVADAMRDLDAGQARGKLVVSLGMGL
ncbi:MAG: NAD(P)-dependent alcohol dehydrogenase [Terracidiphilus sp.]